MTTSRLGPQSAYISINRLTFRNISHLALEYLNMTRDLLPAPSHPCLSKYVLCDKFVSAVRFALEGKFPSSNGRNSVKGWRFFSSFDISMAWRKRQTFSES